MIAASVRKRVDTYRMYAWEAAPHSNRYATKTRRPAEIRRFVARVWEQDGRSGWSVPTLIFKRPTDPFFEGWDPPTSFYDNGTICLIPIHMCYRVALHELVHAKGYGTHGPRFAMEYLRLMIKWCRLPKEETELSMRMFGIRLPRRGLNDS